MLKINNLSVGNIVKQVSLSVSEGKVTVLLGENGSGKTTLLHTLVGAKRYKGNIYLKNRELREYTSLERAKEIGLMAQILPETNLSVRQLAEIGRNPYIGGMGRLSRDDDQAVHRALELSEMKDMEGRLVSTLSGGERQRAFLAMLLAQDPSVILMDEPTAYLDPKATQYFCNLIKRFSEKMHKTVLTVMHDPGLAMEIADQIVILQNGSVVYADSKEKCLSDGTIERCFSLQRYTVDGRIFYR